MRPSLSSFEQLQQLFSAGGEARILRWVTPGRSRGHLDFSIAMLEPFESGSIIRLWVPKLTGYHFPGREIRTFRSAAVLTEHPILREYRETHWELYLSPSAVSDPDGFLHSLRLALKSAYEGRETEGNWKLLQPGELEKTLANRYGAFCGGVPEFAKNLILENATQYSVRLSALEPRKLTVGPETRLLLLDRGYIVGEGFRLEERR